MLLVGFVAFLMRGYTRLAHASSLTFSHITASVLPTLTTGLLFSTVPTANSGGLDSTLLAAFIGLGGVLLGILVAIGTTIYQTRRSERVQRDLALRNEQLQRDMARQNEQLQRELLRAQKDLEREHGLRQQQEQQETIIAAAEVKRQKILRASTDEERSHLYREALQNVPHIALLQILDMKRPLEVANVYVHLRVHHETQLSYKLTSPEYMTIQRHDPNELLQTERQWQEQRFTTAIDPEEAIHRYMRCVILGDPGAGKTTLLKYLTLSAAKGTLKGLPDLVPIYVELNAFVNSHFSDLLDFIATSWDNLYAFPYEQARTYVANQLYEGKALLLLDALDETVVGESIEVAEQSYTKVSSLILQIATRYAKAPMVVTVRKAGYRQHAPLIGFTELDVMDFRSEDIRQFISNWYRSSEESNGISKGDDLIQRLEKNQRLQTLAANPLLLTLIVLVYEAQLDLPDQRAELYKQCVDTLLTSWDAKRNIRRRREFKPKQKRQLLEVVAWHFHTKGQRYFPEHEVLDVIATFLPAIELSNEHCDRVLQEITSEHGLLKEQAHGWYGFLHLTMQEYFVAQYVLSHNQIETLLAHAGDPWWEEVILLYAGQTSDASLLLQMLLGKHKEKPLQEDIFYTNLILAGRCVATRPSISQTSLRTDVTSQLFQLLMNTPYSLIRERLATTLFEIRGEAISARLIQLLSESTLDIDIRRSIASALSTLGEHSVAPELVHLLSDDSLDSDIRRSIASALGILGERSIVPELVRLLSDESLRPPDDSTENDIRGDIASALGTLGERSVAPELVRLLSNETFHYHPGRAHVAEAFCMLERPVVPELLRLLSDESLNTRVRADIAAALGTLGERSIVPELLQLLSDNSLDSDIRGGIASALGTLGERSVAPELLRLLSDDSLDGKTNVILQSTHREPGFATSDMPARTVVAFALGMLGERSVAPKLLRLLFDDSLDGWVRGGIAHALTVIGEPSIARDLVKLLPDENIDRFLRWLLAYDLGGLGERSIVPELVRLLSDSSLDDYVGSGIAHTLGTLGERSVVPELLQLLSDNSLKIRLRVDIARSLGTLGERSVVPELLQLLSDNSLDSDIRMNIGRALAVLANDEETVCILATYLDKSDMANTILYTLWRTSLRIGVRIFSITDDLGEKKIEISRL
jgi:HEAT repeat protein